jgi:glycosyltransferase involved in cell wall biosynthesis
MLSTIRIILDKRFKRYPIVTDSHVLYNLSRNKYLGRLFQYFLRISVVRIINKRNILVFYTTEENKHLLVNKYHISKKCLRKSLIGTDTSKFYFSSEWRYRIREKYNIKDNDIVIIYSGRIDNKKEPHIILESLKLIENEELYRKVFVVFIGNISEHYYSEKVHPLIDNCNYIFIYIKPVVNHELYRYYSMADIAIFPKFNTLSGLDVQACQLPVIMEDNWTNRERIKMGGYLYKKNNYYELAKLIQKLLSNKVLRRDLGNAGLYFIKEHYDYNHIIRNTEKEIHNYIDMYNRAS